MKYGWTYQTPIGAIRLLEEDSALSHILFGAGDGLPSGYEAQETDLLREAHGQLTDYFNGELTEFTVPLTLRGTDFQTRAWQALMTIPYGETRSYKQMAEQVGNIKATRAVGMANNRNPIPIIIPCHRVVGSNGSLTGYAGGLDIKQFLIDLEKSRG